jgi:UBX domain-containing protein 7
MVDDELVSQFLMFTGTEDVSTAASYLEMAAGNLEGAVSLFMDHSAPAAASGRSGGGGGGGMMGDNEIRAPDATQTMRLMDDLGPERMMGAGMMHPYIQMDPMLEERLQNTAFAMRSLNARAAVNSAAAAAADSDEDYKESGMDESNHDDKDDDDESNADEKNHIARLADMFAPPDHLMYTEGGFEGARNMAKDSKRWLLVNIQKDSEFASHALNRDVWRDELVENLVREGFVLWQTVSAELDHRRN